MTNLTTAHEIAQRTGATWRQLSHWVRQGWLECANTSFAPGRVIVFNERQAIVATIAAELVTDLHISPKRACDLANHVTTTMGNRATIEMEHGRLILWAKRPVVPRGPEEGK